MSLRIDFITLKIGTASVEPTKAPLRIASLRVSSSVPNALARSDASPAPIAIPSPAAVPAANGAERIPSPAAGKKAPIEPSPVPIL